MGSKKDLKVLSLFSGGGGMDIGFEGGFDIHRDSFNPDLKKWKIKEKGNYVTLPLTRFKTVFACDVNKNAQQLWQAYFKKKYDSPKGVFRLESVVSLVERWRAGEKDVFPKGIDVLTGGFPCQDFSKQGKRQGFNSKIGHDGKSIAHKKEENRGNLYFWMKEAIKIIRPKVFIAENVEGILSFPGVIEKIVEDFREADYHVFTPKIINTADYGVPQQRRRVFFLGVNKKILKTSQYDDSFFPDKTHSPRGSGNFKKHVTLKSIFFDLSEPEETDCIDQKFYKKNKYHKNYRTSQFEIKLNRPSRTICTSIQPFRRLDPSKGGVNLQEILDGKKQRRLTVRECARIQTFPNDYFFMDKTTQNAAFTVIGNAVPCLMSYHFAKRLEEIWDKYF